MSKVNFKFGDFCRLCLKQAEDLVYLKAVDTDLISFVDKLEFVNSALKPENDIFPNWICLRCKKQLNFAYKFSKKCLKSLTVLSECFKQIQQNHFGNMGKLFYITNIRNVQKTITNEDDPLTIKDEEMSNFDDENSINFDQISIPIKQEPDEDIEIDEHPVDDLVGPPEDGAPNVLVETCPEAEFTEIKLEPHFEIPDHFLSQASDEPSLLMQTDNIRSDTNRKKFPPKKNFPKFDLTKPEKPIIFTCSICFRSYQSESLLANHITMHENIYSCALCGKSFKVKDLLARHLESHLTDDEKHYICKICGLKFTNVRKFRQHYSEHSKKDKMGMKNSFKRKTKADIFECNICTEKYDQKRALIIHMRTHF